MERTVTIGGGEITLRATALTPRLYRHLTGHDLMRDMDRLRKDFNRSLVAKKVRDPGPPPGDDAHEEEKRRYRGEAARYQRAQSEACLDAVNLEVFENISYIMARQASCDPAFPKTPDAWLDGLDGVFSVYEIFPVINELWTANVHTTAIPKKK